jgi:hypothetical protein
MADKREQLLARLLEVAAATPGVAKAVRNRLEVSETNRPAIVLLDADEVADESTFERGRPSNTPNRVNLTPEVYILLGSKAAVVGTDLNTLRAAFVKLVLTDTPLRTLVGTNGQIVYMGCATDLARGRTMEGEMAVSLMLTYVLKPEEL